MERNIDVIKTLKEENKRLSFDLTNKTKEVEALRKERNKHDNGITELNQLVNALIVNCAVQFGEETETGYVLTLPKFSMQHCLEAFTLKVRGENTDGTEYIFEAIEVAKVKEAQTEKEVANGTD